ncbi:MAG TPA: N-acetylmuramoyl-L-alanine amidase [Vicinamibacterales bacterium]|nr:N-acetylmuramoyl-L-alanine amidase [Vicinamibacterales bacterium]
MLALATRPCRAGLRVAGLGIVLVAALVAPAAAQSAATLYERTLEREQTARASGTASVESMRAIARSYELIVRKFPASAYCDNALWQAAGLMKLVFTKSGDAADRQAAERLLVWLRREYPSSSFVPAAGEQLVELEAAASAAPATAPAAPVPPAAATVPPPSVPTPAPVTAAPAAPPPAHAGESTPVAPAAFPQATTSAVIKGITQTTLPRGERITIELNREVVYAGERVVNPDRVFVDFTNASAAAALAQRAQKLNGQLIKGVRVGRHSGGVTRVVLELAGSPRYSTFPLYNPFRLVVDVESDAIEPPKPPPAPAPGPAQATKIESVPVTAKTETAAVSKPDGGATSPPARASEPAARPAETTPPASSPTPKPAAPAITSRGDYSLARQLGLGVARIVIDAGHGGHDPGAQANGINEAELVLDVAQRLEKLLLQHEGVQVVLTRRGDEFIPLEERTAIANRESADLFLSIHANASHRSDARGIETYFLNFATNPDAERVAARENATSAQTMGTLPAILRAIAFNNKLDESRELASIVQTQLVRKLRAQNKGVRDLGVKQAPFVVLIGAQMPSVLAEISFVTNRSDAGLLKQAAYRQQIAQALYDGIVKYQMSLKKVTVQ